LYLFSNAVSTSSAALDEENEESFATIEDISIPSKSEDGRFSKKFEI
jgi:hypothetical protein